MPRDSIDAIRLSRISSETTVEIELGCAMRYLDHAAQDNGTVLRIRLERGYDCQHALRNKPSSLHRPQGARMANLSILEFDSTPGGQADTTPISLDAADAARRSMRALRSRRFSVIV